MDSQRTKAKGYISIHNQEKGEERLGKPAAEFRGLPNVPTCFNLSPFIIFHF